VITGVIKANFPSRIAFQVASKVDSRTIIDANGAEKLLGKGDMLFVFSGRPEVNRIHGAYISTEETLDIVTFLKEQGYQPRDRRTVLLEPEGGGEEDGADIDLDDELFDEAARIVIHADQGSVSLLQRRLRVGYSRAARLVDLLEEAGVVGPFEGSKAREVLVGEEWLRAREGSGDAGAPEQDD
jgi:S-DNA-T family DNA segregation ATPase FtsK/SpoIIIE